MQKITFEVCAGSYQDCLAAEKGGADRVELNSALSVGGLTPSLISLMRAKKETSLRIVCMVRPRAGGFCYDETEAQLMLEEAELLLEHGADGIAFAQHCSQSFRISTEIRSNCWLEAVSTLEMYGNSWKRQAFVRYILPANPTAWILLQKLVV